MDREENIILKCTLLCMHQKCNLLSKSVVEFSNKRPNCIYILERSTKFGIPRCIYTRNQQQQQRNFVGPTCKVKYIQRKVGAAALECIRTTIVQVVSYIRAAEPYKTKKRALRRETIDTARGEAKRRRRRSFAQRAAGYEKFRIL